MGPLTQPIFRSDHFNKKYMKEVDFEVMRAMKFSQAIYIKDTKLQ